jgi:phosphatidylserine/phosphatidylglycerophosphate/cardiolipin synthase-like enzyme
MKKLLIGLLFLQSVFAADGFKTYFSPYQGEEAFEEMFEKISNAKEYAYITVYSWSMRNKLEDSISAACKNGAKVYVVINNDQQESRADREAGNYKKLIMVKKDDIIPLEEDCAEFKYTNKTMHEKFVIVDDEYVINSSANFSGGAISRYSESFISFTDNKALKGEAGEEMIRALKEEFEVLFNYSKNPDYDKDYAPKLLNDVTVNSDRTLEHKPLNTHKFSFYSTGMNHEYTVSKTARPKAGNFLSKKRLYTCIKDGKEITTSNRRSCDSKVKQFQVVVDMVAEHISAAKKSIYLGVNYLIHDTVCDAVIAAVEKGLDVRVITDNKQMKSRKDCTRILSDKYSSKDEIVNKFRYKTYSHFPSRVQNFLQHSKYILIDYDDTKKEPVSADTKLIMGSHNLSYKAENSNFENMSIYETEEFKSIYEDFYKDFNYLYTMGRDKKDQPSEKIIKRLLTPESNGAFRVHFLVEEDVMALSYKEYKQLRKDLLKKAPGMLDYNTPRETLEMCRYYDPQTKKYFGGRGCR